MSEQRTQISYVLYNLSKIMLMIDTGLRDKDLSKGKKNVALTLMDDKDGYLIQSMGGYSAQEILESPGVKEHLQKKMIRSREQKQTFAVSAKK